MTEKDKKQNSLAAFIVLLLIFACLYFVFFRPREEPQLGWLELRGHIWSDVDVYMGKEGKSFAFTILGGNDNCSFGRGLFVKYPSGNTEWKDRDALIQSGTLFVKASDPALKAQKWIVYECP